MNAIAPLMSDKDFATAFLTKDVPLFRTIDTRIQSMKLGSSLLNPTNYVDTRRPLPETLFDLSSSFKVLTSQVSMHLDREWRDKLFKQLDSLLDAEEWEPQDLPPSLQSFSTLLRMLLILKPERKPGLGATSDGHLVAAWTEGINRLTIHCMPRDQVLWMVTRDLGAVPEKVAGTAEIFRLPAVLAPYEPAIWFNRA